MALLYRKASYRNRNGFRLFYFYKKSGLVWFLAIFLTFLALRWWIGIKPKCKIYCVIMFEDGRTNYNHRVAVLLLYNCTWNGPGSPMEESG